MAFFEYNAAARPPARTEFDLGRVMFPTVVMGFVAAFYSYVAYRDELVPLALNLVTFIPLMLLALYNASKGYRYISLSSMLAYIWFVELTDDTWLANDGMYPVLWVVVMATLIHGHIWQIKVNRNPPAPETDDHY